MSVKGAIETGGSARAGRPRDPEVDRAIAQATLQALAGQGYRGMSVEGVAAAAGVGKTTIYRRYASKEELVAAALSTLRQSASPIPDTGSVRTDLAGMMAQARTLLPRGLSLIGAVLAEEDRHPELMEIVRERVIGPRRDEVVGMLQKAMDRQEIRSDIDPEAAVHAIVGSVFVRRLLGTPESDQWIHQTVEVICQGMLVDSRGRTAKRDSIIPDPDPQADRESQ